MKDAFVTLIVGERYQRFYDRVIRPSHERLAARSGRPLVVLRAPIAGGFPHAHPSWQKLRIFEAPELAGYDRLCWLDADLYAMREAPDPFEHARDGWLAVDNDTCGSPAQAALDRLWHWPAKAAAIPDRLVNTGLFVVHRELHAALFRAVHDGWGGRWDQGPLSFHLQALEGHLASSDLNRVVVHVLADAGFGPRGLRALVERPGLVHFAAASALRGPALDYVVAADEGRRAVLRELELRSLRDALVWAGNRRWVAARRRARDRAAGPWWRWQRAALSRALRDAGRLQLSPHQSTSPGHVAVDVIASLPPAGDADKLASRAARRAFAMPTRHALELAVELRSLVLENVLERTTAPEALLAEAARTLARGGRLEAVVATGEARGPEAFRRRLDAARTLTPERLADAAKGAGLRNAEVAVDPCRPDGHAVLTWVRGPSAA